MFWDILFNYAVEKMGFIIFIAVVVGLFIGFVAPFSGASHIR